MDITNRLLSINQLSKLYNLPDITLFRDFKKLLHSNVGAEGKDFIKYYKNPRNNKFEWRIDPVWFEENVDRKINIQQESVDSDESDWHNSINSYHQSQRDVPIEERNYEEQFDNSIIHERDNNETQSWFKQKIDELTEMLKNFQVLLAQKEKQIDSLQKRVFLLEDTHHSYKETVNLSDNTRQDKAVESIKKTDTHLYDDSETLYDVVNENAPDRELHENVAPYEPTEHDTRELLTSINTLENIVTTKGHLDTTELRDSRDTDTDPWEAESARTIPEDPNIRGGETDPRVFDSDLNPITEDSDDDAFTKIARERGY